MALIKSISGIRGTIGGVSSQNLTPLDIVRFTAAYAAWLQNKQVNLNKKLTVVVGRDGRMSGSMVHQLVIQTLVSMGINVLNTDISTTPTVEVAVTHHKANGGIIITASHNPKEWNALKLLNGQGEFLSAADGAEILKIAETGDFLFANVDDLGNITDNEYTIDEHIQLICKYWLVDVDAIKQANFTIVADVINSSGAIALSKLFDALGVTKFKLLNSDITGNFAHNPEPLPENLSELSASVVNEEADLGIVVDPDVDRLAFVCENGDWFGEEYTLVAVADYVLQNKVGNTVSNLSSTKALQDVTEKYGGTYYASAVGEVNVVQKMKDVQAVIGGEGNGGVIVPDFHYGRDALIGIALFLTYMAKSGKTASHIRSQYPNYYISKQKININPDTSFDVKTILAGIAKKYNEFEQNNIDGLRINVDNGWVHLRSSNTEPIIRVYAEQSTQNQADDLANKLIADINILISN